MVRKLSAGERDVLLWLAECYEAVEREGTESQRRDARNRGVPWDGTIGPDPATTVAAITLQRLEERGLVRRRRGEPSWDDYARARSSAAPTPEVQTTHVLLTHAGQYLVMDLRRSGR